MQGDGRPGDGIEKRGVVVFDGEGGKDENIAAVQVPVVRQFVVLASVLGIIQENAEMTPLKSSLMVAKSWESCHPIICMPSKAENLTRVEVGEEKL